LGSSNIDKNTSATIHSGSSFTSYALAIHDRWESPHYGVGAPAQAHDDPRDERVFAAFLDAVREIAAPHTLSRW